MEHLQKLPYPGKITLLLIFIICHIITTWGVITAAAAAEDDVATEHTPSRRGRRPFSRGRKMARNCFPLSLATFGWQFRELENGLHVRIVFFFRRRMRRRWDPLGRNHLLGLCGFSLPFLLDFSFPPPLLWERVVENTSERMAIKEWKSFSAFFLLGFLPRAKLITAGKFIFYDYEFWAPGWKLPWSDV